MNIKNKVFLTVLSNISLNKANLKYQAFKKI